MECAFEFESTTTDVTLLTSRDFNGSIGGEALTGFFVALTVHADFTRQEHGLGFLAGLGQASFDQNEVESLFDDLGFLRIGCHWASSGRSMRERRLRRGGGPGIRPIHGGAR